MALLLFVILAIVLLVALGSAFVGLALMVLWWALIGLAIGGLGRLIVPGREPISILATALSGIAASILGGVIARAAHLGLALQFVIAVAVAAILVATFSAGQRAQAR